MRRILSLVAFISVYVLAWCQSTEVWQRAQLQYDQGNYEQALNLSAHYLTTAPITDSFHLAEVNYLQANAHYYLGSYLNSLAYYDRAVAFSPNSPAGLNLRGMVLFDRAFAEYELQEYLPSYQSTRAAEAILSQLENPNTDYLLSIYGDLAYTATELGFFEEAALYINRGEKLLYRLRNQLELPPNSIRKEVVFAYARTQLYSRWNKEAPALAALQSLRQLTKHSSSSAEEQRRFAVALNEVADMYLNFPLTYPNATPKAHDLLDQAFAALDTTLFANHYWQFTFNRAKAFRLAGDANEALALNRKLIATCPEDDPRLAFFWAQRGLIELSSRLDAAQAAFQTMLNCIHQGPELLREDYSNFVPSTVLNHSGLLVEVADEIIKQQALHPGLKAMAAQFYRLGLYQFQHCFDGRTFNAKLRTYYEKAVAGLLRTNADPLTGYEPLLEIIDQIENQLAWQRFNNSRKVRQLSWPDSLYQQQLALRQALVSAQQDGNAESVQALQDDIRQLEERQNEQAASHAFKIEPLQASLTKQQLILKYGVYNEELYLFGISKTEVWVRRLEDSIDWKTEVATYLHALRQIEPITNSARRLGNFLLPQEIAHYKEIFIVPCRELANLPFHALIHQSDYLIQSHAVSYAPHLVFLGPFHSRHISSYPAQNLVIAPQQDEQGEELIRRGPANSIYLQGAENESRVISELMSASLLAGEAGTRQAVIDFAPKAALLHIATHAVFDTEAPNLSYLQLAQGDRLYLEEIYGLSIPSDLVFLSACQTATSGNFGRSLHAFHRAFFQAGAPSVIAGLWELPDQATSSIVENFYRLLKDGKAKHLALREAQLTWLASDQAEYQHPFFWAGLVLQGDRTPIFSNAGASTSHKLMFILVVLGVVLWWSRKKVKT